MTVDMSPHAVTLRLQMVSKLRDLCLVLASRRLPTKDDSTPAKEMTTLPAQTETENGG
jgi:hypothetical protein